MQIACSSSGALNFIPCALPMRWSDFLAPHLRARGLTWPGFLWVQLHHHQRSILGGDRTFHSSLFPDAEIRSEAVSTNLVDSGDSFQSHSSLLRHTNTVDLYPWFLDVHGPEMASVAAPTLWTLEPIVLEMPLSTPYASAMICQVLAKDFDVHLSHTVAPNGLRFLFVVCGAETRERYGEPTLYHLPMLPQETQSHGQCNIIVNLRHYLNRANATDTISSGFLYCLGEQNPER